MFNCMKIAETMYEDVVEASYKIIIYKMIAKVFTAEK